MSLFAADSTGVKPIITTPKKQGYINIIFTEITYPTNPAKDSQPIPPRTCVSPQEIVNIEVGPAKKIEEYTACSKWGCSCSGLSCLDPRYLACGSCVASCNVLGVSCSCPFQNCTGTTTKYKWSDTESGQNQVRKIICGTPDWK